MVLENLTIRAVDISTKAALHEMVAPGVLAVVAPLLVGIILGPASLAGLFSWFFVTGVGVSSNDVKFRWCMG